MYARLHILSVRCAMDGEVACKIVPKGRIRMCVSLVCGDFAGEGACASGNVGWSRAAAHMHKAKIHAMKVGWILHESYDLKSRESITINKHGGQKIFAPELRARGWVELELGPAPDVLGLVLVTVALGLFCMLRGSGASKALRRKGYHVRQPLSPRAGFYQEWPFSGRHFRMAI